MLASAALFSHFPTGTQVAVRNPQLPAYGSAHVQEGPVHPMSAIATLLAQILRDYGFHVLALSDAVDAIAHVENLLFDVAVVSDETPSTLPEVLFQSNKENWIEILIFKTPEVWEMAEFMLTVSEAAKERDWMCYWIAEAWHAAWHGEAGQDIYKKSELTKTERGVEEAACSERASEIRRRLEAALHAL